MANRDVVKAVEVSAADITRLHEQQATIVSEHDISAIIEALLERVNESKRNFWDGVAKLAGHESLAELNAQGLGLSIDFVGRRIVVFRSKDEE